MMALLRAPEYHHDGIDLSCATGSQNTCNSIDIGISLHQHLGGQAAICIIQNPICPFWSLSANWRGCMS